MRLQRETRDRARLIAIVALFVGAFVAFQQVAPDLDIEGFLKDVAERLGDWTYALVGVLAFLETGAFVGLVFPGETAVIIGGALAGQGENSVELMLAIVWFCAWAGDSVSFVIGSRLGRGFILRHGPKVRITNERFGQVESYFERHGGKTILIGRFIGLVRALAPFIAGSSGMRYRAFVPYSILGTGLWAATFTLLGYFLSDALNEATELAGQGTFVFGAVVAVAVALVLAVRFLRQAENRARLVARLERTPVLRRAVPQLRFFWRRITPGTLGLQFTSVIAALAVGLFVLVGYITIVNGDPSATVGDERAFTIAEDLQARWLTEVAQFVTGLGSGLAMIVVAAVAAVALGVRRRWPELVVLVAAVAIVQVVVPLLKDAIDRPRPGDALASADGSSFPSGHAAFSVIYPWLALTLTVRVRPRMTNATLLIVGGIAVAAVIGLSRVYLHVHYLSDVSAGWGLGVSTFAACAAFAMLIAHVAGLRQNARS